MVKRKHREQNPASGSQDLIVDVRFMLISAIVLMWPGVSLAQDTITDHIVGRWKRDNPNDRSIVVIAKQSDGKLTLTRESEQWIQRGEIDPGKRVEFRYKPKPEEMDDTIPPKIKQQALDTSGFEWRLEFNGLDGWDSCAPTLRGHFFPGSVKWKPHSEGRNEFESATPGGQGRDISLKLADTVRLCDASIMSVFVDLPKSCPPLAPSTSFDASDHAVIAIPADWTSRGPFSVTLTRVDNKNGSCSSESEVSSTTVAPKAENSQNCALIWLDGDESHPPAVPKFWQLSDGSAYRVRVRQQGAADNDHQFEYQTPAFTSEDIDSALSRRLDSLARNLTGMSFNAWKESKEKDASGAKQAMWKHLYLRGGGYYGRVTIANLLVKPPSNPQAKLSVAAKFGNGGRRNYGTTEVLLSDGPKDVLAVALGRQKEAQLAPFNLDADRVKAQGLEDQIDSFELALTFGAETVKVTTPGRKSRGFADPIALLAMSMRTLAGVENADEPPERYEGAVSEALKAAEKWGGTGLSDLLKKGKQSAEDSYSGLESLANTVQDRMKTSDAGLAAADSLLRDLCRNGNSINFGMIPREDASSGRTVTRGDGVAGWPAADGSPFTLNVPPGRKAWAFFSKLFYPEGPSYSAQSWLPAGNQCGNGCGGAVGPPQANPSTSLGDLGLTAEQQRLAQELLRDPAIRSKVERGLDEQAKGAINELIGFRAIVGRELPAVRQANPQFGGRIVALGGEQFSAGAIPRNRVRSQPLGAYQLSDGMVLGVQGQGDQTRVTVFRIIEAKAGQGSAEGVADQVVRDMLRISNLGMRVQLTDAQRTQLGLGSTNTSAYTVRQSGDMYVYDFGADVVECDPVKNPQLFQIYAPRDVRVPTNPVVPADIQRVIDRLRAQGLDLRLRPGTIDALSRQLSENRSEGPLTAAQLYELLNRVITEHLTPAEDRLDCEGAAVRERRLATGALGAYLAGEHLAPALEEVGKLNQEQLRVRVATGEGSRTTYVTVSIVLNGKEFPIEGGPQQRNLLQSWYSEYSKASGDDASPSWLRGCPR